MDKYRNSRTHTRAISGRFKRMTLRSHNGSALCRGGEDKLSGAPTRGANPSAGAEGRSVGLRVPPGPPPYTPTPPQVRRCPIPLRFEVRGEPGGRTRGGVREGERGGVGSAVPSGGAER